LQTETVETAVVKDEATAQIQSLAWIIVLVSFMLFCSFSIALTGGVYYFFFRSSVPMDVVLQVGRGTVGIESLDSSSFQSVGASARTLQLSSVLSTDAQSQATISFQIPQDDGSLTLGTITLEYSSSIQLDRANYPRFEWSSGVYTLEFSNFIGEADVFISQVPSRPFELYINTPSNATFVITHTGRYTLISNATSINLITIEGQADLLSPNRSNNRRAISGEQIILRTGSDSPAGSTVPTNLIRNGLFTFDIPEGATSAPIGWACQVESNDSPLGTYTVDEWMGRRALRFVRLEGSQSSTTRCRQDLELNVSQYNFLELQVTFSINFQSLQNCGIDGSECPLMLFLFFTDANGDTHEWSQGLFYWQVLQSSDPTYCQSCPIRNEHLPTGQSVWFTYESGNLIGRFSDEQRPEFINFVRLDAKGHQYDVFISEVAIIASSQAVIPTSQLENDEDD
jgi:hypothetical protein